MPVGDASHPDGTRGPPPRRCHNAPVRWEGCVIATPAAAASEPTAPVPDPGQPPAAADPAFAGWPAHLTDALDASPDLYAAARFGASFEPKDGVEYGWVVKYAEARYALVVSTFKSLDDKAGAIITSLGSGTGLLTLGSLVAATAGQLSPWVIAAAFPAIGLAAAALWCACFARQTIPIGGPPSVAEAVGVAEHFARNGDAAFLGQWHVALIQMRDDGDRKARQVDRAARLFAASVTALALPLLVALGLRLYDMATVATPAQSPPPDAMRTTKTADIGPIPATATSSGKR